PAREGERRFGGGPPRLVGLDGREGWGPPRRARASKAFDPGRTGCHQASQPSKRRAMRGTLLISVGCAVLVGLATDARAHAWKFTRIVDTNTPIPTVDASSAGCDDAHAVGISWRPPPAAASSRGYAPDRRHRARQRTGPGLHRSCASRAGKGRGG